jgi:hypothetical protein
LTGRNWSADFAKLDTNLSEVRKGLLAWLQSVGTLKIITGSGTTTTTLYTVPTGKTFYFFAGTSYNQGAYQGMGFIADSAGNDVFEWKHPATAYQPSATSLPLPVPLPAGYSIKIAMAGGTESGYLIGYEV